MRTGGGGRLPNAPTAGGVFVANLAQNQWETGDLNVGEAAVGIVFGLVIGDFIGNLFDEF